MRNVKYYSTKKVALLRWGKYDQKIISSIEPDLYNIVVEYALLGVRRTLFKPSICDQIENNLNRNDGK